MTSKELRVSAKHVAEEFAFDGVMVATATDDDFGKPGWYVSHKSYGCSKTQPTAEQAVRRMLAEHGCTNIMVRENVSGDSVAAPHKSDKAFW